MHWYIITYHIDGRIHRFIVHEDRLTAHDSDRIGPMSYSAASVMLRQLAEE